MSTLLRRYGDDALFVAGCLCILRGLAMWSEMVTWIAAGVMLIVLAVMIGARHANT